VFGDFALSPAPCTTSYLSCPPFIPSGRMSPIEGCAPLLDHEGGAAMGVPHMFSSAYAASLCPVHADAHMQVHPPFNRVRTVQKASSSRSARATGGEPVWASACLISLSMPRSSSGGLMSTLRARRRGEREMQRG
jgi:hypothetical protein